MNYGELCGQVLRSVPMEGKRFKGVGWGVAQLDGAEGAKIR